MIFFLRKILVILVFFIAAYSSPKCSAQGLYPSKIPSAEWVELHKDSLRSVLLNNKKIPYDYEHSILAALTFYPDLEDAYINFKTRALTTTMAALPSACGLFRKRENRRYSIIINETKNRRKAPLIKNVPWEARVGVIGHELAHIVDYNQKSFLRIVGNGIAYLFSNSFKRNLEYKIDKETIRRGLGEGLLAFRLFIEEEANTTNRYKRFKEKIYMTSQEIAQLIEELNDENNENII